jgi:aryl-phospho-beta-D-glucosidase BglC (GH1 family)
MIVTIIYHDNTEALIMYKNEGYMAGANLGHWISQYGKQSHEHFTSYIVESDIKRINEWGMDHVRVPVDYFIFEDDGNPGVYMEDGLIYIDNCLSWCKKYGVNMIIDLHHAPGFFFGNGDKNNLMENRDMQTRYINIWKFFSQRYINEGDNLEFELLNELVAKDVSPWNDLWQRTAAAIHAINPARKIVVGGNNWNAVTALKNLTVSDNPNILYTFHMYQPMIFTHQRASWMEDTRKYTTPVEYPFNWDDHTAFWNGNIPETAKGVVAKDYIRKTLQPAAEFIEKNKRPLYCGEYGVIANASVASAIRWCNDLADVLLELGIGRAVWSYRGFSNITDKDNKVTDINYVKAVSRK